MTASLEEMLGRLGDEPDVIAAEIAKAGITAVRNEPCDCAVARWLTHNGYSKVDVMLSDADGYVVYADDEIFDLGDDGAIPDFIRAFDNGSFPQLEAE